MSTQYGVELPSMRAAFEAYAHGRYTQGQSNVLQHVGLQANRLANVPTAVAAA
jgi:hypothetical protein